MSSCCAATGGRLTVALKQQLPGNRQASSEARLLSQLSIILAVWHMSIDYAAACWHTCGGYMLATHDLVLRAGQKRKKNLMICGRALSTHHRQSTYVCGLALSSHEDSLSTIVIDTHCSQEDGLDTIKIHTHCSHKDSLSTIVSHTHCCIKGVLKGRALAVILDHGLQEELPCLVGGAHQWARCDVPVAVTCG